MTDDVVVVVDGDATGAASSDEATPPRDDVTTCEFFESCEVNFFEADEEERCTLGEDVDEAEADDS